MGVDGPPTLLELARDADPSIPVHLADAAALPLESQSADLAIAFMSLHDVDDLRGAVREIARLLKPAGRLCLAIVHPLNSAGAFASQEANAPFLVEDSYLASFRYADTVERDGLTMTFHSQHRPLQAFMRALEEAGLVTEALREPTVPPHAVRDDAERRWLRVPLFLHVRARR